MVHQAIYTIGHSTHSLEEFIAMLQSFNIQVLADIRSLPGSRKFPHFDKENLEKSLPENGIEYMHLADLGGRRKVKKDSKNNRWNNDSFKGYADYMETIEFENAILHLEKIALKKTTAFMCAEAIWWRCHRSMVSDYLKAKGWDVRHIMSIGKSQVHRYTSPAIIEGENVLYSDEE
ncbi:MAG: DUF488 domain-containing protein [Chitinophagales bacterium]|nr:DUF488 domain-containing protein [Chitinophagales bacterium]MBP8753202.1 DUF488 domain-containing protein [Chitinophagales bacterium]MBP9188838.1 DUF488 domain-containing protein [Chitinophagales bacterium]MBP9548800.1 DUF488 domain-containing protein [Chitinophagales bacterium]MBP9703324.1 DUF488 domain-containing protein [Chitinophagales bacterium]